jgi:GWxTD domain-containing protein
MLKSARYLIVILILCATTAQASIRATFDYKQFLIPGEGFFLETLLSFDGRTLDWVAVDSTQFQSSVQATIVVTQGEDIIDFRKTKINSPIQVKGDFVDFIDVQRFLLPRGKYALEIELVDLNDPKQEKVTLNQEIDIVLQETLPCVSSVTFVQAYAKATESSELTKSGYDLLPLVSDFFPPEAGKLVFYAEAYNTERFFTEDDKYLLTYALWGEEGPLEETRKYLRKDVAPVTPLLEVMDISAVPEGNYQLVIEIRTKENEEVASEAIGFYRAGQPKSPFDELQDDYAITPGLAFNNPDSMREYVSCLYPIARNVERNTIRNLEKGADMTTLRSYFETFWMDRSPDDPLKEWMYYVKEVWKVEAMFATPVRKGYDTDRGRVWLQYGEPNTRITRYNETEVFPYEIWHYYKIGRFNNKRFLFYSRTVVNIDFELLHSDVPGEVQNENWPYIMRSKNNDLRPTDTQLNRMNPRDTYSRDELEDLFYNPR